MSHLIAAPSWSACHSALQLDRLRTGELTGAAAAGLRAHLASCATCSAALAGLEAEDAGARLPSLRVVPLHPVPSPRPRSLRALAAAGSGLAAAASLALLWRPAPEGERLKGAGLGLDMYVQHGEQVRRTGPGAEVARGDAVRFSVTTPAPAYVAVLSLDPSGRGSVYFPLGVRAEAVSAGVDVPLPLATRLDDTAGVERLLGLFCSTPVELAPVRAGLERGEASFPPGCQVIQWSFVKR